MNKKLSITNTSICIWDYYEPTNGAFCLGSIKNNKLKFGRWYVCREEFARRFSKDTKYVNIYYRNDIEGKYLIKFLKLVEKKLNLSKYSSVYGVQTINYSRKNHVSIIKLSPWWARNAMRRALLTILLRCGLSYRTSFDKALYSRYYTTTTKKAVEKFFKGYTRFGGIQFKGWVGTFGGLSNKNERNLNLLIK